MARTRHISNNQKRKVNQLIQQASKAVSMNRYDICNNICNQIEAIWPENPELSNIRGIITAQSGAMDQSIMYFTRAVKAAPKRGDFCKNLATIYVRQHNKKAAAHWYQQALALMPSSLSVAMSLASILIDLQRYDQAQPILKKMHAKHPENTDILMGLATIAFSTRCYKETMNYIAEVLARSPDHQAALLQKAHLLQNNGQVDNAETTTRQLLSVNSSHSRAGHLLSSLKTFTVDDHQDIDLLENIYNSTDPDSKDREFMSFALGKVMDDIHDYDRAFNYFSEGNSIRSQYSSYQADAELAHMHDIMQHYKPELFQYNRGLSDATPIFIVGMPRCGSTLVEQILAAHPDVSSRGEWHYFEDLLNTMHSPDNPLTLERVTTFDSEQWKQLGQSFLQHLKKDSPDALRITDKTLINIRLIGAIHCALPQARIIHVRRHPLDNCLSIYQADLISAQFDYIYKLGELGSYYRMYQRLMQHWRDILPEGVMYELDYEQLVSNQENETRKLLNACDLNWNDRCMKFNKADNIVITSSVSQVRRSMYSDSIARWKHYEKHLQPLINILGK